MCTHTHTYAVIVVKGNAVGAGIVDARGHVVAVPGDETEIGHVTEIDHEKGDAVLNAHQHPIRRQCVVPKKGRQYLVPKKRRQCLVPKEEQCTSQ